MEEYFDVLTENGEFTGHIATRKECHEKGLWHRVVYAFIINKNGNVLLQKRSENKKLWPNMWDLAVGGHVDSGEIGSQALIRECKEELGLNLNDENVRYLDGFCSINEYENIINKHFNECYLITKDVEISKLKLQKEEVSEIRWFSRKEILDRIKNNYDGLVHTIEVWNFLQEILRRYVK